MLFVTDMTLRPVSGSWRWQFKEAGRTELWPHGKPTVRSVIP
jgi:hypothetical protein